jgi:hypothetical protein
VTKARKQPFAFTRESAQSGSNDSEGHLNPFLNFLALAGPGNRRSGLRITIQPQDDATTDLATELGESLLFCATLLFEHAVEADLLTVRQHLFSQAEPTRQRHLPR